MTNSKGDGGSDNTSSSGGSSSASGRGVFGTVPVSSSSSLAKSGALTNIERLSAEERSMTERVVQRTRDGAAPGVVVAVVRGAYAWDLRPLLLDTSGARGSGTGVALQLARVSDPQVYLHETKKQFSEQQCAAYQSARKASVTPLGVVASGIDQGQFWIRRKFYDRTLADVMASEELQKSFSAVQFAQRLISAVAQLHRAHLIHGHLCPNNVAIEGDEPVLIDFAFQILLVERVDTNGYLAPELATEAIPTPAADVYALGKILEMLLASNLSVEHREFLALMQQPDPLRRPSIEIVEERFVPSEKLRIATSPTGRTLEGAPMRAGKLLSAADQVRAATSVSTVAPTATERAQTPLTPAPVEPSDAPSTSPKVSDEKASIVHVNPVLPWKIILPALLGLVVLAFITTQLLGSRDDRSAKFREQWESTDSTQRDIVVHAAVSEEDETAQQVIINDVVEGAMRPGVRTGLLRVAFNSLWRDQLSHKDRQQALALALSPVLREIPSDLPPLRESHPAVQLAACGDLGLEVNEPQFKQIPVSSLAELPAPYGVPFGELQKLGVKTMGDPLARALAHIVVGNLQENEIARFVGSDNPMEEFLSRSLVIAPLAALYPPVATELQRLMRARDDVFTRRMEWFRTDPSKQWGESLASTQVLLALGLESPVPLTIEQRSDLLTFPAARVREDAAASLTKEFSAARSGTTLQYLSSEEHRLSRPQVVLLMSTLLLQQREPQNPSVTSFLSRWFETRPDIQSVLGLLTSRREVASGDLFSLEAARYLNEKSWEATLSQLRDLTFHHEKLARALAYSRLDPTLSDENKLLNEAVRNESDARLRDQLLGKLKSASILEKLPENIRPSPNVPSLETEPPLVEDEIEVDEDDDQILDSPL